MMDSSDRENVMRTGVHICKQNDWAFLSQARVSFAVKIASAGYFRGVTGPSDIIPS